MRSRSFYFLIIIFIELIIQPPAAAQHNSMISQYNQIQLPDSLPKYQLRLQHCLNGLWDFKCDVDTAWTQIPVPGCYSILRSEKWAQGVYDYPRRWTGKCARYRRGFEVPETMNGMNIRFYCGGCFHQGKIYVNGMYAGKFKDGYMPFEVEIESLVKQGENIIEIVVDSAAAFTDATEHFDSRGIWQDTFLKAYPKKLLIEDDFLLITSASNARIQCEIPIQNKTIDPIRFFIRNFVTDLSGDTFFIFDGGWQDVGGNEREIFMCDSLWETAHLWFPDDPYLYQLHTVLYDETGAPLDMVTRSFGFKEISWRGPHLYFNGRKLFLRGDDSHSPGGIQESKQYVSQWIRSLKELGLNFIRLSHYPGHKVLVETADELGFLVALEPAFNQRIPEENYEWQGYIERMVKTYRNNPSVIMWSLSDQLVHVSELTRNELITYIHSLDPTRPVYSLVNKPNSSRSNLIGYHGDGKNIFREWQQFGVDKPILWSDIGDVQNPKRPLHSGSAGVEITRQDYAAGTWYDGCYQIYDNIARMHDGVYFKGEYHRVNAYIIPNFTNNFFRWQPLNNRQEGKLRGQDAPTPAVKDEFIPSFFSPLNIWDVNLPVFEPLPGFYCFEKYLKPVRFFDTPNIRSFFAGDQIVFLSTLFYDDLRPADELRCRIETKLGDILWENSNLIYLVPGDVLPTIETYFDIPDVDTLTEVNFVRQFFFENEPGFTDRISAKIYPKFKPEHISGIHDIRIGVYQSDKMMQDFLHEITIPFKAFFDTAETNVLRNFDLILSSRLDDIPHDTSWVSYFNNGGKLISIFHHDEQNTADVSIPPIGAYYSIDSEYMFTQIPAYLKNAAYIMTALDDFESGKMSGIINDNNFLNFRVNKPVTVYVGYDWRPAELPAWLDGWREHPERIHTTEDDISFRIFSRRFEAGKITLGQNWSNGVQQMYTVIIREQTPEMSSELKIDSVRVKSGKIYEIVKNGFVGSEKEHVPEACFLLNGSKHQIVAESGQQDFTYWNGRAIQHSLVRPKPDCNSRVILSGDKDGTTSALHECFQGSGVALFTSLKIIPDFQVEPVAGWLFKKMMNYVLEYRVQEERSSALLLADSQFRALIDSIHVVYEELNSCEQLLNAKSRTFVCNLSDSANGLQFLTPDVLDSFTAAGGKVFIPELTPDNLDFFRGVIHPKLNLTTPYQGETKHCVKAAVSWSHRDTPKDLIKYYDNILIPQPFEPNFDPLLTGISNNDLHWDGMDMFEYGVEIEGMNPVGLSDTCSILMSNWTIDWSRPEYGGDYIHAGKDERRVYWFLNRNAVTFKIKNGDGYFLICQLDLTNGGDKGRWLMSQLLTGIGVAIGQPTFFSSDHSMFDFTDQIKQCRRFSKTQLKEKVE